MLLRESGFSLPKGWLTPEGELLQTGTIRPTTGLDEFIAQSDPRVVADPLYLPFVLLSQVITGLGHWTVLTPTNLESLFLRDMLYLQWVYHLINQEDGARASMGELSATPWSSFTKR